MAERGRPRMGALLAEAGRMASSQPVPSIVSALLVGACCVVILATVGQTAAAEEEVLAQIDLAGTRSVVLVDTEGRALLRPQALDRIAALAQVEWVIGLGSATDVTNAAIDGGSPAGIRTIYGQLPGEPYLTTTEWDRRAGTALVGPDSQTTLGLRLPAGGVEGTAGNLAVVGSFQASDPLSFLNRGLLAGTDPGSDANLRSIHIIARSPQDVAAVADAARALAGPEDPTSLAVETSEAFALLRAAVAGELGRFSRHLVLMVLAAGILLIGITIYGSITGRRRDFGRRRALGASRTTLTGLVITQTLIVSLIGATIGTAAGLWTAKQLSGTTPDLEFSAAVATLAILAAAIASLPPALIAAYRDPVRILRVP